MKITRISLWHVPLTSHTAYHMAEGKTCDTVESVVLALDTDSGLTGWGEVCPIPHYLPAYARGVVPAVEEMAPVLLGADPVGPEAVTARLDHWLQGHPYAKSAIDIALWDLTAQAAGLPLHSLLGGRRQADMPLYHSITCIAPEEMARIAHARRRRRHHPVSGEAGRRPRLGSRCRTPADGAGGGRETDRWFMATGTAAPHRWMPPASAGL